MQICIEDVDTGSHSGSKCCHGEVPIRREIIKGLPWADVTDFYGQAQKLKMPYLNLSAKYMQNAGPRPVLS